MKSKFLIVEVLKCSMLKCLSRCTPSPCTEVGKCSCQRVVCVLLLPNVPLNSSTFLSYLPSNIQHNNRKAKRSKCVSVMLEAVQRGYSLTLVSCCPPSPQHGHSHFPPAESRLENSIHNGDVLEKKDSIILKAINTIATDKSNPSPDPQPASTSNAQVPAPTGHVPCQPYN